MNARASVALLACIGVGLAFGAVAPAAATTRVPSFSAAKYYKIGGSSEPHSLAVGDLNGDGKPDVVVAGHYLNAVSVLLNRGDGTYGAKQDYGTGREPSSVAIADFDGDGTTELVTANAGAGGSVSVLHGPGDGTFDEGSRLDYPTGSEPWALAIGDLNGDGMPDLVTTTEDVESRVAVFLNRGDGTFLARVDYPAGRFPISVAIGDLNGDGKPDLAVANLEGNAVSVLLNRGDGTFESRRNYWTGKGPKSVAISDLNGDGARDLVTVQDYAVSVFLNRGDGTFQTKRRFDVDGYSTVAIDDLNGDGSPDLAVANVTNPGSLVAVLLNKGNGSFRTDYEFGLEYATRNPIAVAISDVNGDGRPDFITASINAEKHAVSVLINKPGLCNVQYVLNAPLLLAKRVTVRAHCRVGKILRTHDRYVKKGRVASQRPKFGAVLPGGGKVDLVVSKGQR